MSRPSRDLIFDALRRVAAPAPPPPAPGARPPAPADAVAAFQTALAAAGGDLLDWRGRPTLGWADALPEVVEAEHLWSARPRPPGRGVGRGASSVEDLAGLDVAVVWGVCGVAESGAIWHVPSGPVERAASLLADHLVVVVPAEAVVADLHAAYARVRIDEGPFGWFLAGPSKTADIEQALVLGAHGPRRLTAVVVTGAPTSAR